MKLTLLILLLAGVVSATQDLRGSEAAQDLESMEEVPLRALKSSDECKKNKDCGSDERCNSKNKCVRDRRNRTRASRRGRCNTTMKVVAVLTDGDERRCAKRLRSNNSMTSNLHPNRMRDFSVARVGDCSSGRVKNRMENLESRKSTTSKDVKMVFVVMSEDDFSSKCRRAIKNLPDELEKDLRCGQIRRMHDNRTRSNSEDFLVIRLNRESQCTTSKLERKVLNTADFN
ncbi:hypothetical protein QTG54_004751 [Skeletonema marinoi]|uniref:Uncharacterized protein n=1 Tax=Skeletonema marinoi TaxID=267567 RepID=A0AAD8YDG1_9STRA|nr:hypothetical protein QTG54_004751 [Skeletonema marinoi]